MEARGGADADTKRTLAAAKTQSIEEQALARRKAKLEAYHSSLRLAPTALQALTVETSDRKGIADYPDLWKAKLAKLKKSQVTAKQDDQAPLPIVEHK